MSLIKEFREFALRGNVVDLAVGVIIGSAFGKIISSLVGDIIMPVLGLLIGGIDFKQLYFILRAAGNTTPAVVMNYGLFIQSVFDFLLIALAIFATVKLMNHLRRMQTIESTAPSNEEKLLTEIRDLLTNVTKLK
ncbi:large-conductance mechanosensitive channel protein MscL [Candidatus Fukatsuia symbiotica]|uniref:Large-conductance mechanosensitive channel n=1 Tax=Candidatus Fukatsuia symbiotica TaxID=1878942 RepID=A0A2U8I2Q4_9GAMM|nr:large-conductance mechanosensitive channel protein MscL [Candidatus Fukatsuia symbiotica]AWK13392.1 large-conductance mechanosensitive channel [Candidatus Fukatsuia symbiotica]MEA9444284.1 large-conductance mechanosensitive channel protein MscL [Candidatus Fukatsuia symbiotica]